jgi:hypothetical protein
MAGPSRPQEPPARVNHAAEGHCFSAGSTVCRSAQSAFADPDAGQFAENNLHDLIGVFDTRDTPEALRERNSRRIAGHLGSLNRR